MIDIIRVDLADATTNEMAAMLLAEKLRLRYTTLPELSSDGALVWCGHVDPMEQERVQAYAEGFVDALRATS
jgi:hypothetical protein